MTDQQIIDMRTTALRMARELHPDSVSYNNPQSGIGGNTSKTSPTSEILLATAEKIFIWLRNGSK